MIVVRTPLRLSILGGGTDFDDFYKVHGGAVLSTAINQSVYVIVKKRYDDMIYVNYSKKEIVDNIDNLEHGLVREAMRLTNVLKGVEITTLSDVPADGTGLGSSSSITVGLLHALYTHQGDSVTFDTLAEQACHIEIDILKKPIGRQDQYIAAYGNIRFITFNDKKIGMEKIDLSSQLKRQLETYFMLFYTGISRKAEEVLSEQRNRIEINVALLSELKGLALEAKKAVLNGDFNKLGELIHKNWELKKGLASLISNSKIDEIYETARQAGAIGGKVSGAGGGGFFLIFCPPSKQDGVRKALHYLKELPFRFQEDGSKIILNYKGII